MLTAPLFMMQVFDRVLTGRQVETLFLLTVIALVAFLVYGGMDWARNQVMFRAGAWFEKQLAGDVIVSGLSGSLKGAPIGAQGLRDLNRVRDMIAGRALFPFLDLPWGCLFFLILFAMHVWLGVYAVISAVIILVIAITGEWFSRQPIRNRSDMQVKTNQWVDQAINQSEAIHALGMRANLIDRYRQQMLASHKTGCLASIYTDSFGSAARTVRQVAQLGIMALAAWLLLLGEITPGIVVAGAILLARALAPFDILIASWYPLVNGWAAFRRLEAVLRENQSNASGTEPPAPTARLTVQNVHKALTGKRQGYLLKSLEFSLEAGQAVGIMGPSGAGKTSLAQTLVGLLPPDLGDVRLDGACLDQWSPDSLGRYLGYLPQDVGLPPATVAETIARLETTPDMEMVFAAAKAAGAHEMILRMPDGYDTKIGSDGLRLSGGQRQRIGLARALFGDPVLIVLDEPDAHLDMEGVQALVNAIQQAKKRGAMVVLVSHRPGMLQAVDKIIVMKKGKIAEIGDH
ncbi:MAG: type I secretion system permease/ATPase, partial [Gammaproteobacteria bacterium]|nr:type I secretion system permease/ATPase [Gammaproteobacteria bacterium]